MHKRCLPRFAGTRPRVGPGSPAAGLRAEGRGEPMMWRDSMLTASAPVTGQPHSKAQQHLRWCPTKWCLYSSGSVSVGVSPCVAESIHCVSSSVCTCACVTDSEQTLSVRGAASQLIRCGRCSYQVLQQLLLTPPSIFPEMASRAAERGHRRAGRCRQRCRIGCNCAISHLIPFICSSSAGREVANLIWPIVLSAAVYLQFWHSAAEFQIFVRCPAKGRKLLSDKHSKLIALVLNEKLWLELLSDYCYFSSETCL